VRIASRSAPANRVDVLRSAPRRRAPAPGARVRPRRGRLAAAGVAIAAALAHPAAHAAEGAGIEPRVHPTWIWAVTQIIPSPEWLLGDAPARFGARWQVTPLLYSFGIHRRLSPWRSFIAEPIVRHAGSVELFGAPEVLATGGELADSWILRAGVRAYFPILDRGEHLSCSVGGSAFDFRGRAGAAYEAGVYTLFGVLGLQLTYSPAPHLRGTTLTLNVRYF
jgi:hypothetical protein